MELYEFVEKFAGQFDETDVSEISVDTYFQELDEWSSLTAMSLIALAKTEFDKVITGKEIRSCETVEDLFNLISSK